MKNRTPRALLAALCGLLSLASAPDDTADADVGTRDVAAISHPNSTPAPREQWAVIVGVSEFANDSGGIRPLKYADDDAQAMYDFLVSPAGGAIPEGHIRKLINADATLPQIRAALQTFLKQPSEDDVVIIYLAGHGAPDYPDRPDNIYFLTYDTDPDDIASTALPVEYINDALERTVLAQRVVVLVDTCHGGAVIQAGQRGSTEDAETINRHNAGLALAAEGTVYMSSAEKRETSQESARWGEGHGVFTYYLLEGLGGSADEDEDGYVRAGELYDFVLDKVAEDTGGKQHPDKGHKAWDRDMVMSVADAGRVHEVVTSVSAIVDAALILADRQMLETAVAELQQARSYFKGRHEPAGLSFEMGRALYALGRYPEAEEEFEHSLGGDPAPQQEDNAHLFLVACAARTHDQDRTLRLLRAYQAGPLEGDAGEWASSYRRFLRSEQPAGKAYFLLVGVEEVVASQCEGRGSKGAVRNTRQMMEAVATSPHFPERHSELLVFIDQEATRSAVLEALNDLTNKVTPYDLVHVHLSLRLNENESDVKDDGFTMYDSSFEFVDENCAISPDPRSTLRVSDLRDSMEAMDTSAAFLTIDGHVPVSLLSKNRGLDFQCMAAAPPGSVDYYALRHEGQDIGVFSYSLARGLTDERTTWPMYWGDLRERVSWHSEVFFTSNDFDLPLGPWALGYEPWVTGRANIEYALPSDPWLRSLEVATSMWRLSPDHTTDPAPADPSGSTGAGAFPGLSEARVKAFLDQRDLPLLTDPLNALRQGEPPRQPWLPLAEAIDLTRAGRTDAALELVEAYMLSASDATGPKWDVTSRERFRAFGDYRALVVGIDAYESAEVPSLSGCRNDARLMKQLLEERFGFPPDHVVALIDDRATGAAIRDELRRLQRTTQEGGYAVFYFAGCSGMLTDPEHSSDSQVAAILPVDFHKTSPQGISTEELAEYLTDPDTTLIFDTAFERQGIFGQGETAVARSLGLAGTLMERGLAPRVIVEDRPTVVEFPGIEAGPDAHPWLDRPHGIATALFAQAAREAPPGSTLRETLAAFHELEDSHGLRTPVLVTGPLSHPLFQFSEDSLRELLLTYWDAATREPILASASAAFGRLVQRRGGVHPGALLGQSACARAIGLEDQAVVLLEAAIAEGAAGARGAAELMLGEMLYRRNPGQAKAIALLEQAAELRPDDPVAQYYLAMALSGYAASDLRGQAANATRQYMLLGAPKGWQYDNGDLVRRAFDRGSAGPPSSRSPDHKDSSK